MKVKTLQKQRGVDSCEQCGNTEDLTIDHKIPQQFLKQLGLEGHADDRRNLWVLCTVCNEAKGNRLDLTSYRKTVDHILDVAEKLQKDEKDLFGKN